MAKDLLPILISEYQELTRKRTLLAKMIRLYQKGTQVPSDQEIGSSREPSIPKEYPQEGPWGQKMVYILQQEQAPLSPKSLVKEIASYESGGTEKAMKKHISNNDYRLIAKKISSITEPGLNRKYYIAKGANDLKELEGDRTDQGFNEGIVSCTPADYPTDSSIAQKIV